MYQKEAQNFLFDFDIICRIREILCNRINKSYFCISGKLEFEQELPMTSLVVKCFPIQTLYSIVYFS